jgi:catechol 2,3-dioxygenase-like lactoylglutathione lyase family enzyme
MTATLHDNALATIRHLDYVILLCDDPARMRGFYDEVMGFPVYRDKFDGGWVELRVGSVLLVLRPRGWLALNGRGYDGGRAPDSASIQLAFRVAPSEVDACHARLLKQGVEVLDPPTDQPWGHRTLFFRDPEGNLLEIYADL